MNTTSQLYQSIISGLHRFEVRVNIAGTDYGMDKLVSLRTSNAVFGSGAPQIGLAPAGEISLAVYAVFAVLAILGNVADPTTEGLQDSDRAMTYEQPWSDQ